MLGLQKGLRPGRSWYSVAAKSLGLRIPRGIARWVYFLMDRHKQVNFSSHCFSECGTIPSGVPQGTKLGPWLFILMISDLHPSGFDVWKYMDEIMLAEVVPRGGQSVMQVAVSENIFQPLASRLVFQK